MDYKRVIEAILFVAGRPLEISELKSFSGLASEGIIKQFINELKEQYKETAIDIIKEDKKYRMAVKPEFLGHVEKVVPNTELGKQVLETLAVIVWKQPTKQSEVVKIRTNKAYEHIKLLEKQGFIKAEKAGLTKILRVTPKFKEYFDIGKKEIKEVLDKVKQDS